MTSAFRKPGNSSKKAWMASSSWARLGSVRPSVARLDPSTTIRRFGAGSLGMVGPSQAPGIEPPGDPALFGPCGETLAIGWRDSRHRPNHRRTTGRTNSRTSAEGGMPTCWLNRRPRASADGAGQEVFLFQVVQGGATRGRAGRLGPADMAEFVGIPDQRMQAHVNEAPRTHVLGLLLQPHHFPGVGVPVQEGGNLIGGPGVELLHSGHDGRGSGVAELVS